MNTRQMFFTVVSTRQFWGLVFASIGCGLLVRKIPFLESSSIVVSLVIAVRLLFSVKPEAVKPYSKLSDTERALEPCNGKQCTNGRFRSVYNGIPSLFTRQCWFFHRGDDFEERANAFLVDKFYQALSDVGYYRPCSEYHMDSNAYVSLKLALESFQKSEAYDYDDRDYDDYDDHKESDHYDFLHDGDVGDNVYDDVGDDDKFCWSKRQQTQHRGRNNGGSKQDQPPTYSRTTRR